jgi:cellulose synthase/poly-beta-1,6-N-acetylglucosamine synthase-like glycosyltransferase
MRKLTRRKAHEREWSPSEHDAFADSFGSKHSSFGVPVPTPDDLAHYDATTVPRPGGIVSASPETRASAVAADTTTSTSPNVSNGSARPSSLTANAPVYIETESGPRRTRSRKERLMQLATTGIVLAGIGCIVVTLPGAWVLLGVLLIGPSIISRGATDRHKLVVTLLAVAVGVTSFDYMTWRVETTNWPSWWIAVPLLAAEMFGAIHTLGLQYTIWPCPGPQIVPSEDPTVRPIFIFIPTVNESLEVLGPTIRAALEARRRYLEAYPHGRVSIVVCNDGRVANAPNWRETEHLARQLGVTCVTRVVGGGMKAGNLEHARQEVQATGNALVAIFDADQVAKPEFLLKTIPPFADPTIAWVQTGQYYSNLEQPVARWANDQQALFYRVLCPGKAAHNAAFICGTNVVLRAAALDQIGGLPQDSVTEDFAASIELHPRWRSIFLTDVLATGFGPMDLPAYLKQQRRWAIGTLGVLRTHWRAIVLPKRDGLRLPQRIQYFLACTHYLCGLRDLIYVLAPVAFLLTGVPAVRGASLGLFLWHFMPYWIAAQAAFWYAGRGVTGLSGIIIGFGSFPALIQSLLTVILGRRSGFMVTSKQRRATHAGTHLIVYVAAFLLCIVAIAVAFTTKGRRPESVAISVLWVIYTIGMLVSVLWLGISDLRFTEARANRRLVAERRMWAFRSIAWRPSVKLRTIAVSGALLASSAAIVAPRLPSAQPMNFVPSHEHRQSPYLGLSLPVQMLNTRPAQLEQQVCLPFTVIGRTQVIHDSFDIAWADHLAAHGERPWITLQFGTPGVDGKPPLDASLPAIANGVQDANIQRWAQEIRAYGKPVYLTILLHVDRNWSVSSGVANGGIPQDVPRTWEHVQTLFKAAGATNVAWVWAPADPQEDRLPSDTIVPPPESTIDAVLQSMIRYPGTPWPKPAAVLKAVVNRHPTKPIFVEVSALGPSKEKAAWLEQIAAAARSNSHVYALLYHEGGPDVHVTAAEASQWSLESDSLSLRAVKDWRSLAPTRGNGCG